jgi:large subunit ribosomal protein L5
MADTDEKKEKKPEKSQQSGKPEKADKAEKAAKAAKGEQGGKGAKAAKPEKGEKGKAAPDGKGEKAAAPAAPREPEPKVPARLKVQFEETIRGKLAEQFGYKNRFEIPVLDKIVVNMGIGEGVADRKKVESAAADLALIAGQRAVITKARKSIATYKLRAGPAIGC